MEAFVEAKFKSVFNRRILLNIHTHTYALGNYWTSVIKMLCVWVKTSVLLESYLRDFSVEVW